MSSITITIPEISEQAIADLETLHSQTLASELEAVRTLREKYAPLAKHNGFVRIGHWSRGNQNWSDEKEYHYRRDGRKIKGFLALDDFHTDNDSEFAGRQKGFRVYLLESGEWLLIQRDGRWSSYQGSPEYWTADPEGFGDGNFEDFTPQGAAIQPLSDEQVAARFDVQKIVEQLGESLKGLAERIPQRMTKLRQRAELASKIVEALK